MRGGPALPIGKKGCGATSEDRKALMLGCRDFEAHVWLLKPVSTDALAWHARPTLTTQLFAPDALRSIWGLPCLVTPAENT
jgi:hypothetical protein